MYNTAKNFFCYNCKMLYTILAVFIRIISNSYINVFQKLLTGEGQKASVVNFYSYLGLAILISPILFSLNSDIYSLDLVKNVFLMGFLGALGNYFIIKALSIGELSTLAPINSYKPIVAIVIGILYLNEIPSIQALFGIVLIIFGTYFILEKSFCTKHNIRAIIYRVLALILSASEAILIKKLILLSDVTTAFALWVLTGLIFSSLFIIPNRKSLKIVSLKNQFLLILAVGFMQYSTNFVFARINVAYALALFQLSTLLSVILGAHLFHEQNFKRKILASIIMVIGAIFIIID